MRASLLFVAIVLAVTGVVSQPAVAAELVQPFPELRLSLHDAIQAAIDNNVNVRLLRERIAAAQSAADTSLGALLPNVSGYATGRNQTVNLAAFGIPQAGLSALGSSGGVTQPFDVYDARASLVQNIFSLSLIQRWRAAKSGVDVASLEAEVTKCDVMATVGLLYMEAIRAAAAVKARQADMDLSQQLLKLAQDRKKAGVATGLDVTREEVQLENTRQRLLVAQNDQESAKLNVIRALGIDFDVRLILTDEMALVNVAPQTPTDALVVARAGDEGSEQKLVRAGANRVSSPYHIGGVQMAQALIRPAVMDFLELATQSEHLDLQMEELTVEQGSRFDGQTPCDCGLADDRGLVLIAVKRTSGHLEFNPGPKVLLGAGDKLIVLGQPESLKRLESIIKSQAVA